VTPCVKLLESKGELICLVVYKKMVQDRRILKDSLITHPKELVMHLVSYKVGIIINNRKRLCESEDGHENQDNFIYILTGGVT